MHLYWLVGPEALVAGATAAAQIAIKGRDADTHRLLRLSLRVERYGNRAFAKPRTHDPIDLGMLRSITNCDRHRQRPVGRAWKIRRTERVASSRLARDVNP